MAEHTPLVVVIGAGFAGVRLAQGLAKAPVRLLICDQHNYHLFQPLLYQVATAGLSATDIAYPIRRIFRRQKNVEVALARIDQIDLANQLLIGRANLHYDYLVLAVGATHSYFGHQQQWEQIAPGLKTIDDALEIRKRVLLAFEEAEHEADPVAKQAKLTFVVIGGGPTGVELAGALREIAAKDIPRDFRRVDTATARIILIHGDARLLMSFAPKLGDRAKRDLEAMGVEVRLKTHVTNIEPGKVWMGDESLEAGNILWAAGVQAPKILETLGVERDRSGRVKVQPDLSVPGHPNVFVVGDAASLVDPETHQPVPGLAPAAMQMGSFVAKIIAGEVSGKSTPAQRPQFRYWDKGTMATIGTRRAVAQVKKLQFGGLIAWLLWCMIHLSFLVSFRSKLFVMLGWIYAYIFRSRSARLITGPVQLKLDKVLVPEEDRPLSAP